MAVLDDLSSGRFRPCDWGGLQDQLDVLVKTPANDGAAVRAQLKRIVPEYTPEAKAKWAVGRRIPGARCGRVGLPKGLI